MSLEDLMHPFLSAYISSPQWFKSSVGKAYRLLPNSLLRGASYKKFVNELAISDPHVLEKLCREKLIDTLRWTLETVPAYQQHRRLLHEIDQDPVAILSELPLVSKTEIKASLSAYLSTEMPNRAKLKTFTGGSTANPMMFYLHKGVSRSREYAFIGAFEARVGIAKRDVVLALRGRTVPTAKKPGGRLWMYEPIKHELILSSDHLEPSYMPQYIEALRLWRPTFIKAFPSAIFQLARWLAEYPAPEITSRIRGILLYSENVYDYQMKLMRNVFACPVLKHYGHSERVLMAASMLDDERYFFWPQYGYFELVNEVGTTITKPGVLGEIVGTSFDNQVMPFVRYRTGDLAMLSDKPRYPHLPNYPVVERVEGRLQEFIVCRDHRLVSITTMGAAHFDELASVQAIQYEQFEAGRFILKVVSKKPLHDMDRRNIVCAVEEKTQNGCTAEVQEVSKISRTSRGKHNMLVQHLDISHYLASSDIEL